MTGAALSQAKLCGRHSAHDLKPDRLQSRRQVPAARPDQGGGTAWQPHGGTFQDRRNLIKRD